MISAEQIHPLCHELVERRKQVLLSRSTGEIVRVLGELSRRWLYPNFPWRRRAVGGMPKVTGFSAPMAERILDLLFSELTADKLAAVADSELGKLKDQETGPPLIGQIFSGNVPNPAIVSIICALLVRSSTACKASSRDPLSPALFLASLHDADPDLASCVQVLRWKGGSRDIENALFQEANTVVAYGDDHSLQAIKTRLPIGKRFLGFGHKLGFALVARDAAGDVAAEAAEDISLYDQQGCLSPHVVYVEENTRAFAERLAAAMEEFNRRIPRGAISLEESTAVARVRSAYEFRAANDPRVAIWASAGSDAWTVIYEDEPMFATSPLNRVVFVKPLRELEASVAHVQPYLHNVGLACGSASWPGWQERLRSLGVARVCPLGQVQRPPLNFSAGIRPNLRDLISIRLL